MPSVELGIDLQFDERRGSISNAGLPTAASEDSNSIALVRFGAELLSPSFAEQAGRPRGFIRLGGQYALQNKELANIGDPVLGAAEDLLTVAVEQTNRQEMGQMPIPGLAPLDALDADDIAGQGAFIRARRNTRPTWYAAVGLAWQIDSPIHDGWVRLKPSVEYSADEFRFDGFLASVLEVAPDTFELTTIRQGRRVREHRLGPGLELETALLSDQPFEVSVFFATRLLFLVSDRLHSWGDPSLLDVTFFDGPNDIQSGSSAGKRVRFTVQSERLLLRIGAGVRIAFHGL